MNNPIVKDNESAGSAPRLYSRTKNLFGVYASAVPYGAFSYNAPTVIAAPLASGSQVTPVNFPGDTNGYLKNLRDSYGKYLASPQAAAFKAAFPQQYLPIQALPAHLSQPLAAAAAPELQYKPFAPNYFFGTQYKVPSAFSFSATPTPLTQFGSVSQPLIYAGNYKSLFPLSGYVTRGNVYSGSAPAPHQHAIGSKSYYAKAPLVQSLQQQSPQQSAPVPNGNAHQSDGYKEKGQIQAAPAQTSVTAIVNGKKTIVTLDTNPPIPEIPDLNLLEPLTFANPVVPQVQHFLPKIHTATYDKLPTYNVQHSKKQHTDISVSRTNNDDDNVQIKPKKLPKKKNKSRPINIPVKPRVIVKGNPDGEEFSYKINTPNHKETYNEQVVNYNKQTDAKPITYSYNKQSQKEPENYSYSHSSKEPLTVSHVEYVDNKSPKHLVYTLSPAEHEEENNAQMHPQKPESDDSPKESDEEDSAELEQAAPSPANYHNEDNEDYSQRHQGYRNSDESPEHSSRDHHHHHSPQQSYGHVYHHGQKHSPTGHNHKNHHEHHSNSPTHHNHDHHSPHQSHGHHHSTESSSEHELPSLSHSLEPEHRGQEYRQQPKQKLQHDVVHSVKNVPQYYSQPLTVSVQNAFQPITPEYEENIRILPTHRPHAPHGSRNAHIKVNPAQHILLESSTPFYENKQQNHAGPIQLQDGQIASSPSPSPYPKLFSSSAPHILEKSKRVFIKEKEVTPDEMHMRMEQGVAEMVEHSENDENDFEKAYKESALGFPAYESVEEEAEDTDSDVYNPESYGAPRYQYQEDANENAFEQYQAEGDTFPKSLRSSYKDAREDKKEDYYLDFSVNKPDVYADFYKKKADYYKSYKQQRPEDSFSELIDNKKTEKREKKNDRTIEAAPSFIYPKSPAGIPKQNKYLSQYKAPTVTFKYDYSKARPRDLSTYASQPYVNKFRTNFVEPQFQYGFEPITLPLVLDSELAAMASNDSPESEKPGTRKKVYEENWYIKKTRTAAGKPS